MMTLTDHNRACELQSGMDLATANLFARALPRFDTDAVEWDSFQAFEALAGLYPFDSVMKSALDFIHDVVVPRTQLAKTLSQQQSA